MTLGPILPLHSVCQQDTQLVELTPDRQYFFFFFLYYYDYYYYFSVTRIPMQKSTTNFIFGILVGLVLTFFCFAYMTGTSIQRSLRIPVKSDSVSHVSGTEPNVVKSVLTHEDLEKIQQMIKPVQFRDEGHHHGEAWHFMFI